MNKKRFDEIAIDGLCSLFAIPGIFTKAELKAGLRRYEAALKAEKKACRGSQKRVTPADKLAK